MSNASRPTTCSVASAFRRRNPFYNEVVNVEAIIDTISDDAAVAAMLGCVDNRKPPLGAVADRLLALFDPLFQQAETDPRARRHAHRIRRLCGSLVREVLEALGCRKIGQCAMPRHARRFAGRGALFAR